MDFLDSPDVERDFPGLYASEGVDGKSKRGCKEDSDCKYFFSISGMWECIELDVNSV